MDPNQQIFKPAVGRSHWTRSVFEAQVYISKYKVGGERMPGHWCWACDHRSTCEFPGGNHCHKGSSDESLSQIHDDGFGQHQHTCPDFRSKTTSATGVDIRTRQHASCCSRCGVLYLEKPTIQWPRSDYPWGPSSIEQWRPFRSDWQDLERPCSEIGFARVRGYGSLYGSIDQSSVVICQWSMANGSVNGLVCSTSTTCWGFAVSFTHLTTQFAKSGQNKWQLFGHLVNIQVRRFFTSLHAARQSELEGELYNISMINWISGFQISIFPCLLPVTCRVLGRTTMTAVTVTLRTLCWRWIMLRGNFARWETLLQVSVGALFFGFDLETQVGKSHLFWPQKIDRF